MVVLAALVQGRQGLRTTGDPRFDHAADLRGQAADKLNISGGSVAAGALVLMATKIVTAAIAEKAHLSPRQAVVIESFAATFAAAAIGAGGIAIAQLVDQVRTYGKLEAQRDTLRNLRRQVLWELATLGASRVEYHFAEAQLRGGEAAFTAETKKYMVARDLSLTLANILVINAPFAIVFGALAAIDHAIWKKRHETMRRRRGRAVSAFAVAFSRVYQDRDMVERLVASFRAEEDGLFVDERVQRLREIKAVYERDDHKDEVWILLTLPNQNFVDGVDSVIDFYEKIEAMPADELRATLGPPPRPTLVPTKSTLGLVALAGIGLAYALGGR
jgi:hypothetical protein